MYAHSKPMTLADNIDDLGLGGMAFGETAGEMIEHARKAWRDEGYKGLIYQNTNPGETRHAKDFTSYVVFEPSDIRSRFAAFDPAKIADPDLLAGVSAVPFAGIGGLAAMDQYRSEP
jgi:hypothetical protein